MTHQQRGSQSSAVTLIQDGTIDASDVSKWIMTPINSLSGYVNTDVTGDNFVDAGDVRHEVDNNAYNSVSAVTP